MENLSRNIIFSLVAFAIGFWLFNTLHFGKEDFRDRDISDDFHQAWNDYRFGEQHDRSFPGLDRKVAIEYFAASEKAFRTAVTREPDRPELYYDLGNALFKAEKYPEAMEAYLKAASLNPEDPDIQFNLKLTGEMEKSVARKTDGKL